MVVSHLRFKLAFTSSLYVVCNAINFPKLSQWFVAGDSLDYGGLIAYLVSGLCLFIAFFHLFAHRYTTKPLAVVFIVASAAATYFIQKYNVAIDTSMIANVLNTDLTEVRGLLSVQMLPYLLFLVVAPVVLVTRVRIEWPGTLKYLGQTAATVAVSLTLGLGAVYAEYDSIHRAANVSDKSIINMLVPADFVAGSIGVIQHSAQDYRRAHRKAVQISGRVAKAGNLVVVLVIGESARQKNFELYGYQRRPTNPVLRSIQGLHRLNGIASIGTTYLALREILAKEDIKLTTITSQLGIETRCYANFSLYENCEAVGEVAPTECAHGGECYDEDVVPLLAKNLSSYKSGYRLVVLHLGGGSHGPLYYKRHPPEYQVFQPQCRDADVVNHCTEEELYNSYDNSILYTDHVLGQVVGTLESAAVPYVMMYVSDHGESLLEGGRIFHGMPPGISLPDEQAHVPLLVKSSVDIKIGNQPQYTQPEIFDTVLDLFSIETDSVTVGPSFIHWASRGSQPAR
jgi:lipid A ethanolaminephosphotransferase